MKEFIFLGAILIIFGLCAAGCASTNNHVDSLKQPSITPTAISKATQASSTLKFHIGDVVVDEVAPDVGWIILDIDTATHQYKTDMINKNDDGTWGWRYYPVEDWTSQSFMEEGSPYVSAHIDPSKIINKYPSYEYWLSHKDS